MSENMTRLFLRTSYGKKKKWRKYVRYAIILEWKIFVHLIEKGDFCMIERVTDNTFDLHSKYQPAGDQPEAIEQLAEGIVDGKKRKSF